MNIMDIAFYAGIVGSVIGLIGIAIGIWALCTRNGRNYMKKF
jgi:hypothetical protein